MSIKTQNTKWVHLNHDDDTDEYVIHSKDGDRFVITFEEMVRACSHAEGSKNFINQFKEAFSKISSWLELNSFKLERAYLSVGSDGIDLTVIQKSRELDKELDDSLLDLDIEIASNPDLNQIRLEVMALPLCSTESARSFVPRSGTMMREFA